MVIGDIIRRNAKRYPEKDGLVCRLQKKRFSWVKTNERVNRLANGLRSLGIEKGDRVAILSRNCHQYLETYWANGKNGSVTQPLNTMLTPKDFAYMINHAEAKAVIVDPQYADMIQQIKGDLKTVDFFIGMEIAGKPHPFKLDYEDLVTRSSPAEPLEKVEEDDLYFLMYTAGTTGLPKGVMHTHKTQIASWINNFWAERPVAEDVLYLSAPLFHTAGCSCNQDFTLVGCTNVISWLDPIEFLECCNDEGVTGGLIIPSIWKIIAEHPDFNKYDTSNYRILAYGGGPMPPSVIEEMVNKFPKAQFVQHFGQTETGPEITHLLPKDHVLGSTLLYSVGQDTLNTEVMIVDDQDNPLPPRKEGEIVAKGPSIMKGYWKEPEMTAEAFRGGWHHTGDVGYMDEQRFVFLTDRKKDIICSGGENISSIEVEGVILKLPEVAEACVIGVPHEKWQETPKAYVVIKPEFREKINEAKIIEHCKLNMARFKCPSLVEFIDKLPRNPMGKLMKYKLREKYWPGGKKIG